MTFERLDIAGRYVQQRLAHELSPLLYYHSQQHTLEDVYGAASSLAQHSDLSVAERELLLTAVLFHDLAWVHVQGNTLEDYARSQEHEAQSAAIARQVLPGMGYSSLEIAQIESAILATRLPQQPGALLENLIVDADMSTIGRPNFWLTSMALREELAAFGNFVPEIDWYRRQYRLFSTFTYFSAAGQAQYDRQRQANADAVRVRLEQLGASLD